MFSAKKLIKAREEMKLSRTDLLFALDKVGLRISHPTIYRWESGKSNPSVDDLIALAKFFGKDFEYFFTDKS